MIDNGAFVRTFTRQERESNNFLVPLLYHALKRIIYGKTRFLKIRPYDFRSRGPVALL